MTDNQPVLLDKPSALARVDGDESLFNELCSLFCEDAPNHVLSIREAVRGSDRQQAERAAHSLKSAAGNIGAESVRSICLRIEAAARDAANYAWAEQVGAELKGLEGELKLLFGHLSQSGNLA